MNMIVIDPDTIETLTYFFACVILILPRFMRTHFDQEKIASLSTTAGVFFTFLGVWQGLMAFDTSPDRLSESVPGLLQGLKMAFLTSVAGLATNYVVRTFPSVYGIKIAGDSIEEKTTEELLLKLVRAINGDREDSLLTQMQSWRTEVKDSSTALRNDFADFASKVAESNSNELIKALEQVMADFNSQINDQFGENFKELNKAVHKLVEWQDGYAKTVEETWKALNEVQQSIAQNSQAMDRLRANSESFYQVSERLSDVVQQTATGIESFAQMAIQAKGALPVFEASMENISTRIERSVENAQAGIERQGQVVDKTVQQMTTTIQRDVDQFRERLDDNLSQHHSALTENISSALEDMTNEFVSVTRTFTEDYGKLAEKLRLLDQTVGRS